MDMRGLRIYPRLAQIQPPPQGVDRSNGQAKLTSSPEQSPLLRHVLLERTRQRGLRLPAQPSPLSTIRSPPASVTCTTACADGLLGSDKSSNPPILGYRPHSREVPQKPRDTGAGRLTTRRRVDIRASGERFGLPSMAQYWRLSLEASTHHRSIAGLASLAIPSMFSGLRDVKKANRQRQDACAPQVGRSSLNTEFANMYMNVRISMLKWSL